MSDEIKVQVKWQGSAFEIDTPLDIQAAELMKQLVSSIEIPATDREGRPISYRLDNHDTGKTLEPALTLAQNGVANGHQLSLTQSVTAGA